MSPRRAGGAAFVALAGLALWACWRHFSERRADEAIEAFLAQHWAQPLAPQGNPPADFTPPEAALGPEGCGACHAAQLADWKTSLHARAMGPGILWQLRTMKQPEGNDPGVDGNHQRGRRSGGMEPTWLERRFRRRT